jgi:radical SAM superfamily enzyme YgiQ (UPF0313 family)
MDDAARVLLISCYELGRPPLGVAWPAAFLERAGHTTDGVDVSVEALPEDRVRRASHVAISVPMHTALRIGVDVARRVRALNPTCRLAFFGLYAVLCESVLRREGADAVFGGECEQALVAWIEGKSLAAPVVRERLAFPVPSRTGLPPLDRYARLLAPGGERLAAAVESSRGCKHLCRHCPIPAVYRGRFFTVPVDVVIEDARRAFAAGARHITFADPDFFNGPGHALRVARALHGALPDVTFDATIKVEHLLRHRDAVAELAELGCVFVVSAVESLSDRVLARLRKGHTREDVFGALEIVEGAGIAFRPSWLPFSPWATLDDYLEMMAFVAGRDLVDHVDPVQFAIRLLVPPGSLLLEDDEFAGCALDEDRLTHVWAHADPRMDALHAEVTAIVDAGARIGRDGRITFARIWEAAHRAAGVPAGEPAAARRPRDRAAPRLSEPWFC